MWRAMVAGSVAGSYVVERLCYRFWQSDCLIRREALFGVLLRLPVQGPGRYCDRQKPGAVRARRAARCLRHGSCGLAPGPRRGLLHRATFVGWSARPSLKGA